MSKIRLCIDGTPLLMRSAGVKTYLYYWAQAMKSGARGHQVSVFPRLDELGDCDHDRSVLGLGPTLARLAVVQAANYLGGWVLHGIGARADVFHSSNQVRNPPRNTRLTTTLHDMTCWLMPETHSGANAAASRVFAERVIKRADAVIAISESSRDDSVRLLRLNPEKVRVIYPGVAPAFYQVTEAEAQRAAQRYGIRKPFALYVGTIEPRKNIPTMLDAYQQLPPSLREEFDLLLIGPAGWKHRSIIDRLHDGIKGVRYLGYVPETDLPAITAAATVFVYPSLYEGFGLPVAQAMATGRPIVTSNISSLPEVAGDAAVYVDPRSTAELRDAMAKLLLSPDARAGLGARGRLRARHYRWEDCARKSWELFEQLCGTNLIP